MKFKNIETGLIWEVTHQDQINRCKKSKLYEEVSCKKKGKNQRKEK